MIKLGNYFCIFMDLLLALDLEVVQMDFAECLHFVPLVHLVQGSEDPLTALLLGLGFMFDLMLSE